jgi:hypothetical protein
VAQVAAAELLDQVVAGSLFLGGVRLWAGWSWQCGREGVIGQLMQACLVVCGYCTSSSCMLVLQVYCTQKPAPTCSSCSSTSATTFGWEMAASARASRSAAERGAPDLRKTRLIATRRPLARSWPRTT